MIIQPPWLVKQFNAILHGDVFVCASDGDSCFAVKAKGAMDEGAVCIQRASPPAFFPRSLFANTNVLTIDGITLVPSVKGINIKTIRADMYPGKLYMFENGSTYLAIIIDDEQYTQGKTTTEYLINMSNGEIHSRKELRDQPVEINE